MEKVTMRQLEMIFPPEKLKTQYPPLLPEGFELTVFKPGDEDKYLQLMRSAGFPWTQESVANTLSAALPEGIFFIKEKKTGELAATAMANRLPPKSYKTGGELGWVAASPQYKGKGFGRLVCQAVLDRFRRENYREVYLLTDDNRLPALATYLKMGWEPLFSDPSMPERWKKIRQELGI